MPKSQNQLFPDLLHFFRGSTPPCFLLGLLPDSVYITWTVLLKLFKISGPHCTVQQGSSWLTDGPSDAGQFGKPAASAAACQPSRKRRGGRSNEGRFVFLLRAAAASRRHQNESVPVLFFANLRASASYFVTCGEAMQVNGSPFYSFVSFRCIGD